MMVIILLPSAITIAIADESAETYLEARFNEAVSRGWIQGFPDGTLQPNAYITRAQFIALLDNALQLPESNASTIFSDVSPDDWFYDTLIKYQLYARVNATVAGIGNARELVYSDTFHANRYVTREYAVYVLSNMVDAQGEPLFWLLTANPVGMRPPRLSHSPTPSLATITHTNVTRAEAAVIVLRFYELLTTERVVLSSESSPSFLMSDSLYVFAPTTSSSRMYGNLARWIFNGYPSYPRFATHIRVFDFDDALIAIDAIGNSNIRSIPTFAIDDSNIHSIPTELAPYRHTYSTRWDFDLFHFQQVHNGIPVYLTDPARVVVYVHRYNRTVVHIYDNFHGFARNVSHTTPTLPRAEAMQIALTETTAISRMYYLTPEWVSERGIDATLIVWVGHPSRLAWRVTITNTGVGTIIDAHNGEVLDNFQPPPLGSHR